MKQTCDLSEVGILQDNYLLQTCDLSEVIFPKSQVPQKGVNLQKQQHMPSPKSIQHLGEVLTCRNNNYALFKINLAPRRGATFVEY
jgi:hypothetical protein